MEQLQKSKFSCIEEFWMMDSEAKFLIQNEYKYINGFINACKYFSGKKAETLFKI